MSSINIIYVHGFRSSSKSNTVQSLREVFNEPNYKIYANDYDLADPYKCIRQIYTLIDQIRNQEKNPIIIVIGSSMGGFIVNQIHNVYRILINPLLKPSEFIPQIVNIEFQIYNSNKTITLTNNSLNDYYVLEKTQYMNNDYEDNVSTYGLFGKQDEIIKYDEEFKKLYSKIIYFDGGHRIDKNIIIQYIQPIINRINKDRKKIINKILCQ